MTSSKRVKSGKTGKSARKAKLLRIAAKLPEVTAEEMNGHVGFAVRKKRFAWYLDDHHGDGIVAITFKAPPGVNRVLVATDPERFSIPAYSGAQGWAALRLDGDDVDWDEVKRLLTDAWTLSAPKALVRTRDKPATP